MSFSGPDEKLFLDQIRTLCRKALLFHLHDQRGRAEDTLGMATFLLKYLDLKKSSQPEAISLIRKASDTVYDWENDPVYRERMRLAASSLNTLPSYIDFKSSRGDPGPYLLESENLLKWAQGKTLSYDNFGNIEVIVKFFNPNSKDPSPYYGQMTVPLDTLRVWERGGEESPKDLETLSAGIFLEIGEYKGGEVILKYFP